jgi:hypothetical protein
MSGGTTLQPTIRCPLCLAELQFTIYSIYSALLSPAVQHYNRQLDALYGILSGETTLKPTISYAPLYLLRSTVSGETTADSLSSYTLISYTALKLTTYCALLCLARIQPTLCSICTVLLCPVVQHNI